MSEPSMKPPAPPASARPIRAVLFDKDGTLLDFHLSWTPLYRELAAELAEGDQDEAERLLETGGMDPLTGRVRAGSVLAAGNTIDIVGAWFPALPEARMRAMVELVDRRFYDNGIRHSVRVPGLDETLAELAEAGLAMGVATSDGTAAAVAALAALNLSARLPHVFGYDSVPHPKPAPDMVHAFARAAGVPASSILVVGDNAHDLHMARAAAVGAAVGVLTGTSAAADLAPLADAVLPSVRDLPGWLAGLAGRR
jgi:phosphoglycolate phosphatase